MDRGPHSQENVSNTGIPHRTISMLRGPDPSPFFDPSIPPRNSMHRRLIFSDIEVDGGLELFPGLSVVLKSLHGHYDEPDRQSYRDYLAPTSALQLPQETYHVNNSSIDYMSDAPTASFNPAPPLLASLPDTTPSSTTSQPTSKPKAHRIKGSGTGRRRIYKNTEDEKPHLCPVPDCGLRYRYKGDLKVHYRTKHGDPKVPTSESAEPRGGHGGKAFPCIVPSCTAGYSYKRDLIRHFRQKHPDAPIELRMEIEIMETQNAAEIAEKAKQRMEDGSADFEESVGSDRSSQASGPSNEKEDSGDLNFDILNPDGALGDDNVDNEY